MNGKRRYEEDAPLAWRDPSGRWHGLEARYNALLSGRRARRDWRSFFLRLRGAPVRGYSLRLALDRRLQTVAAQALGTGPGAVLALDPRSGAILAMVSAPHCAMTALATAAGLATCRKAPGDPLLNRVTDFLTPPGSIFKIVTLAAALDTGAFSLNSIFSGADAFGPSPYWDNVLYPSNVTRTDLTALTLPQALAFSDNFTFGHIGLTLGAPTLLRYAARFLIGRHIPFDLPAPPSVIANGSSHPDLSTLAQSSFGAATDQVTVLQMALVAAAVANGGVMMAPHLVNAVLDGTRVVQRVRPAVLSRVMSSRAAREEASAMTFVVDYGSGIKAHIAGVKVAGKTGTAASTGDKPNAWFICFAPSSHPIIAVAVLKEFSGEGADWAAPIARRILVADLQEHGYHVK